MSDDADQFCVWLLEQASEGVLQWLSEVWEGSRQVPAEFNWLGLAEISPNLAIKKDDLGWARVAVLVNTYLIVEAKTHGHVFFSAQVVPPAQRERVCFSFEERIMRLRVAFLLTRRKASSSQTPIQATEAWLLRHRPDIGQSEA